MKTISYKTNKLNIFVHSPEGSSREPQLSRNCLTSTKRTSNMTKIKISFAFFCGKIRVEASKVITNSFKAKDFVTPIPFDTFP